MGKKIKGFGTLTTNKKGRPSIPEEKIRCSAKSKQSGERCKNYTFTGKRDSGVAVCYIHGGKAGRKPMKPSPTYPLKFSDKMKNKKNDSDLLDIKQYLASLAVMIDEAVDGYESLNDEKKDKLVEWLESATKMIERGSKVEMAKGYLISLQQMDRILNFLVSVTAKYIPSKDDRVKLAEEFKSIPWEEKSLESVTRDITTVCR